MTRLPTSARRAQLIELGIRLFAAQAYEEVSIDRIADDAGIDREVARALAGDSDLRAAYAAAWRAAVEAALTAA
jgi:2-hydroxychromene-2-carboxylate isomerase